LQGVFLLKMKQKQTEKINAHLDDLGAIESAQHDLHWPDASWEMEYELK
jgi:hypothetical protein